MQFPRGTVNYLQSANKCLDREWEVKQHQATTLSYLLSLRLSTNEGKVTVNCGLWIMNCESRLDIARTSVTRARSMSIKGEADKVQVRMPGRGCSQGSSGAGAGRCMELRSSETAKKVRRL